MLYPTNDLLESRDTLNKIYSGIVVENDDPRRIGRIKVKIKGIFSEDDIEAIPWCRPLLPSTTGGSPDRLAFSVPDIGSAVEVSFRGSFYNPIYTSSRIFESQSPKTIFGDGYPNTSGEISPSGVISRGNSSERWNEKFQSSGLFQRSSAGGDLQINVPGNLTVNVDGDFSIKSNYWQTGGGGLGNILNEIAYAHLNGPYLKGVLDLASALPATDDTDESSILKFFNYVDSMSSLSDTLQHQLTPDFLNLPELLEAVPNKYEIQKSFSALGGVSGISSMVFSFFGLFGAWSSTWLNNADELLDSAVLNLNSQTYFKDTLKKKHTSDEKVPTPDETGEEIWITVQKNINDMSEGFNVLLGVAKMFVFCDEMRRVVDIVGTGNPNLVFSSLPEPLHTYIITALNDMVTALLEATKEIGGEKKISSLVTETRTIILYQS